ncbi:MAG: S8 family serine peptidase, partial [Bacteroidia bacterium]|nr:S8 family serine peptidase [Bacteroidia bacterium]
MKATKLLKIGFLAIAVSVFLFTGCNKEPGDLDQLPDDIGAAKSLKAGNGAASYIIVLNDDFEAAGDLMATQDYDQRKQIMSGYLNRFLNGKGVGKDQVDQMYTNVFMGFAARLSGPQLEKLKLDPRIKSIEPDQEISLGKPAAAATQPKQTTPWGITRVGGGVSGVGKTAWIIDTGIDFTHPDLTVNTAKSKYFTGTSAKDENGHGTHVAGIIAAVNNTIGVIGVAAGATVVSVRVLNKSGSGTISGVVAGCDYVKIAAAAGDVANMSLGGGVS